MSPEPQIIAPMALYRLYLRASILPTPAATGTKVRMMGTKRATMTASPPKRSKKPLVRRTFSMLKTPLSLRSKMRGPVLRPMKYPDSPPRNAAREIDRHTTQIGNSMTPVNVRTPEIISSVSPGSRKPTSSPVSEKTMMQMPRSAKAPKPSMSEFGSSQGMSAEGRMMTPVFGCQWQSRAAELFVTGYRLPLICTVRVVGGAGAACVVHEYAVPAFLLGRLRCDSCCDSCGRRDLNPHAFRHGALNAACLPFHHSRWRAESMRLGQHLPKR